MQEAVAHQTSFSAHRGLEKYFIHDNTGDGLREMKRMNHVNNHYRKCVMTLQSPWLGGTRWFMKLWDSMVRDDQNHFCRDIEQNYDFKEGDFYVEIATFDECPVIFYLLSVLEPLVLRTFKEHHIPSVNGIHAIEHPWHQVQGVLHNPSLGNNEYRAFLDEAYDALEDWGDPLLRMPVKTLFTTHSIANGTSII
jgi:hypothetical protein